MKTQINIWCDWIKDNTNFTFTKFGDGEFNCMMGLDGANCDLHPYTKELSDKLYKAWYFLNTLDNIFIGEWMGMDFKDDLINKTDLKIHFVGFEILLQNDLNIDKYDFYKTIKTSKRQKIFVGPERLRTGVTNFLNIDKFIEVPLINSFSKYTTILSNLIDNIEENCIVMFSAGMMSKALIYECLKYNKNITCLDIGSGFDSLFVGKTRDGQIPDDAKNFYATLINNTDFSIFVNTTDSYKDCWMPFFTLFDKHWKNCNKKIYLNTENEEYNHNNLNIISIKNKENKWSDCLIKALNSIEDEYILYMQDDYFLTNIEHKELNYFFKLFIDNDLDCLHLTTQNIPNGFIETTDDIWVIPHINYRISTQCAFWKKRSLLKYLLPNESGWEFEINSFNRNDQPQKIYNYNRNKFKEIISYINATGIIKNKWNIDVRDLFETNNIKINYNIRHFNVINPTINLFYNYYTTIDADRNKEIDYCLEQLYNNKNIDNYFIFLTNDDLIKFKFKNNKTTIFLLDRPSFKDFFDVSKMNSEDEDINIIINSDCFIDINDTKKLKNTDFNDLDFYTISRHNIIDINDLNNLNTDQISIGSQDCWIYKGKPKVNLKNDFFLGYAGVDNAITYELKEKYNLTNRPFDYKIYHYHSSNIDRQKIWNDYNYRHLNFTFVDVFKDNIIIEKGKDIINTEINYNPKIKKSAYFFWNKGTKFSFLRYLTLYTFRLNHPMWDVTLYVADSTNTNVWKSYEKQDFITNESKEDFIDKLADLNINIVNCNSYSHLNPVHISDIYRWDILVNNGGGWYFDTDQIFTKSFDNLCNYDFVYGSESYYGIGVLGFSRNSNIPKYFQNLVHSKINEKLDDYTMIGNVLFSNTILYDEYFKNNIYNKENVFKTPDNYFYPIYKSDETHLIYNGDFNFLDQKESYAIHWYGGHPISQEFNKKYTSFNYKISNDSISKYLNYINLDFDKDIQYNFNNYFNYKNNIKSYLNDFVDNVYVINLNRREDRLENIKKEFNRFNIHFERFDAIDGKNLLDNNFINAAQIGCLRSHIGVIKNAIEKGYKKIAIFEDDIIFCDDFEERLKFYVNAVPDDWDMMYLGGTNYWSGDMKQYVNKINGIHGCFAMILNNKNNLFNKIIEISINENKAIDNFYYDTISKIFNTYIFVPFFVKTATVVSDICENKNAFSYDSANEFYKNKIDLFFKKDKVIEETINTIAQPIIQPVQIRRTQREICEDYLRIRNPFVIKYGGRVVFDSSTTDKLNLSFYDDHFEIYGRPYSYRGMLIFIK